MNQCFFAANSLFGEKPSSADIVTVALFARLKMIGEYDLVTEPELQAWFERMRARSAYSFLNSIPA